MLILDRIRAHGGDVTRHQWRMALSPGKLSPAAIEWLMRPQVRTRVHEEVWPEAGDWAERAAIREFDGGQDRAEAERDAYAEICLRSGVSPARKMQAGSPPQLNPPKSSRRERLRHE